MLDRLTDDCSTSELIANLPGSALPVASYSFGIQNTTLPNLSLSGTQWMYKSRQFQPFLDTSAIKLLHDCSNLITNPSLSLLVSLV